MKYNLTAFDLDTLDFQSDPLRSFQGANNDGLRYNRAAGHISPFAMIIEHTDMYRRRKY